jgi:hypothetical protein
MYETHPRGLGMPMAMIADELNKGVTTIHRWLHNLLDKKIVNEIRKPRTLFIDGDLLRLKHQCEELEVPAENCVFDAWYLSKELDVNVGVQPDSLPEPEGTQRSLQGLGSEPCPLGLQDGKIPVEKILDVILI